VLAAPACRLFDSPNNFNATLRNHNAAGIPVPIPVCYVISSHNPPAVKNLCMSTPTHWFYYEGNRGVGPVDETEIRGLLQSGAIAADTLVWRDGLEDWTQAQDTELLLGAEPARPSVPIAPHDPDQAFEEIVSGLPRIAANIVHLPAASRTIALQATERSYYELALDWGYPELRAKRWATLVMVALQRAIEDQTPRV
jgi:hypothetical protein